MRTIILALLLACASCAESWQESYTGPESDLLFVNIDKREMMNGGLYGGMKPLYYLTVTNPSQSGGEADIVCDSFMLNDVKILPRTSQHFILPNQALTCSITMR